jgi:hypothetical protein
MKTMAPLQVETVNGQVAHTINNYQHTHHHQHDHRHTVHAHGPVHVHTHIEAPPFALQAPPGPQARKAPRDKPVYDITPAQKALLALMRPLPKHVRVGVLDFMRIEFGTGLVVELDPGEVQRVRRVVLDARRAAGV